MIGESVANVRRKEADKLTHDINFEKYMFGATYVPFEAVMSFLKENDLNNIIATVDCQCTTDTFEVNGQSFCIPVNKSIHLDQDFHRFHL